MDRKTDDLWHDFLLQVALPFFDVDFPSESIALSESLRFSLRLPPETLPSTFGQWCELCHPDDYPRILDLLGFVRKGTGAGFSMRRRLYCGDGIYRPFLLKACCIRENGLPRRLLGWETPLKGPLPEGAGGETDELRSQIQGLTRERDRLIERLARQTVETHRARDGSEEFWARAAALPLPLCLRLDGRIAHANRTFASLFQNPEADDWALTARDGDERSGLGPFGQRTFATSVVRGEPNGEVVIFHDVTELRDTERVLLRLRHALRRGASSFAPLSDSEVHASEASPGFLTDFPDPSGQTDDPAFLSGPLQNASRILADKGLSPVFSTRFAQLRAALETVRQADLKLGVTGITSSGKSTFVNAIMGEPLLPEETRATTNRVVHCRKGPERALEVEYRDGGRDRFSGVQLTPGLLEGLTSERANPGNERGIAHLSWSSPGAALPEGLTLLDTPGLDACDLPGHTDLVLRELLPSMDIVLYVTSIRSRLKPADMELLNAALEQDQRVLFLLAQIDLERDDTEGGRVVHSKRSKLAAYVQELREDAARAGLTEYAILPISSKLAAAHFYDRNSPEWDESNFDLLLRQLESFRTHLNRWRILTRGRRTLVLLRRTGADMAFVAEEGVRSEVEAEAARRRRRENIQELRDSHRWANAEISAVRNEWRRELTPGPHLERLARETRDVYTLKGIRDRYLRWWAVWGTLTARMTERMDRARLSCREILARHGLAAAERTRPSPDIRMELPDFERYVRRQAFEMRARGWFEDLQFWPKNKTVYRQFVDRDKMLEDGRAVLTEQLNLLTEHLSWWENKMREEICDPLYREQAKEEEALFETQRALENRAFDPASLRAALTELRSCERSLSRALNAIEAQQPRTDPIVPPNFSEEAEGDADTSCDGEQNVQSIFGPLLEAFQEQAFQTRFFALPALSTQRRVVLLGLRRHDSLRLLSRLAHDVSFTDSLRAPDEHEFGEENWIFCGSTPPALPHVVVQAPDSMLRELEVLIAPSDIVANAAFPVDWNDLFAEWTPLVHLDVARVDSGLSDLARAPYAPALAHADRWIAASSQGALFHTRLSHLATDVPARLNAFTSLRGYRSRPDWFVYENYDPRYTDFILLGQQLDERSEEEDAKTLLALWKESGLDFRPPFTEGTLRMAFWRISRDARARKGRGAL